MQSTQTAALAARDTFNGFNIGDIQTIQNGADLSNALNNGLSNLYQTVFGEPPYNEVFADDEVVDIFNGYLKVGGEVMVLPSVTTKPAPIAFIVGTPLKADFMNVCGMPSNLDLAKTAYVAEDGVDAQYRRRGISTMMKGELMDRFAKRGFEQAILRTSAVNEPQIQAVLAAGGKTIIGAKQIVERQTKFGKVMEDNRFFMFDLTRR